MITPNKVVTLEESALALTPLILDQGPFDMSIGELFNRVSAGARDIDQFMLALDILYVLGRVTVDFDRGVVGYAETD